METCAETVGLALDDAAHDLESELGPDWSKRRWGELFEASFPHPLSALHPIMDRWLSVRIGRGGGPATLNVAGHWSQGWPIRFEHGASLRAVYDLSNLDNSRFVHAPGQSGHPWSPHYRDLAPRWAKGEYIEVRTDWEPENIPDGWRVLVLRGAPSSSQP